MTVLENVMIGSTAALGQGFGGAMFGFSHVKREEKETRERCMELMISVGLNVDPDEKASNLS